MTVLGRLISSLQIEFVSVLYQCTQILVRSTRVYTLIPMTDTERPLIFVNTTNKTIS